MNTWCKCVVPAYEIANDSLCRDKGQLVVWIRCVRCGHASWFALASIKELP